MHASIIRKSLRPNDLIAVLGVEPYTPEVPRTFRERVGDALLLRREQVKKWSRREAAKKMPADAGTVKAIEQGKNAGWEFFERYAEVLDTSLEEVIRDALRPAERADVANNPEAERIAKIYSGLRDINSRRILLEMAERFRAAESPQVQAGEPTPEAVVETAASTDSESTRTQKARPA